MYVSKKYCGGCIYYRRFVDKIKGCMYTHDTGIIRKCRPQGCQVKHIPDKKELKLYFKELFYN